MNQIEVTPEMRQRVLTRIGELESASAPSKASRFSAVKRYLPAAACLLLLLVVTAILPRLITPGDQDPPVLLPPVMEEAASLRELSELVGFAVKEEFDLPFEAEKTEYLAYGSDLAQVTYDGEGQSATYRKSVGTEDNSGDYTQYGETAEIQCNGHTAVLSGDNGAYVLAVWTDGTFSYSIHLSQAIPKEIWLQILAGHG